MLNLALWLKKNGFRADQVQAFLPTPMATATAMYHTGKNPLRKVLARPRSRGHRAQASRARRLHKAFLRYHDADNWPLLREALKAMGRERPDRQRQAAPHPVVPARRHRQAAGRHAHAARRRRPRQARLSQTRCGQATPQANPRAAKAGSGRSGTDKPTSGKPAPASRGRPPQVPKHPLSQRRGGGKSR